MVLTIGRICSIILIVRNVVGGIGMKSKYITPDVEIQIQSVEDIMEGSDTFIDVGGLFSDEIAE